MKEERQEAMIGFLPRLIQKGDHEICIVAHQAELRGSIPGHTALQIAPRRRRLSIYQGRNRRKSCGRAACVIHLAPLGESVYILSVYHRD